MWSTSHTGVVHATRNLEEDPSTSVTAHMTTMTRRVCTVARAAAALCALLALAPYAATASFRVVAPVPENSTEIAHNLALFGRPTYGVSLVAPLVLAPPSNAAACAAFDMKDLRKSLRMSVDGDDGDETEPFVMLAARGGCHFVQKARQAQAAGAVALVVYDSAENDQAGMKLPVLADDGTAGDIRIPSLVIHHGDAETLMKMMQENPSVVVALGWDVPHPDDRVEFSLWFSSRSTPKLQAFIDQFRPVMKALGDSVKFTPYYDVHLASSWGCSRDHGDTRPTHCPELCVYEETFCTYDPERNNTVGLDGKDVLMEDVRQLCVYEHADKTANPLLFWEYLAAFNERCSTANATAETFNKACSDRVLEQLGVKSMTDCAEDKETGAKLLQSQIEALQEFHVMTFPEFTVNGVPMFGSIECEKPISLTTCLPLKMICAGFLEGTAPDACHESFWLKSSETECEKPRERDECGSCSLRNSPQWNAKCAGCDGVPNSGKEADECGVCGGNGSFDVCGRCLPANDLQRDRSCLDCKGVPNGLAKRDACGVCGGRGSFDACGMCLDVNDPRRQNFACHVIEDPDAVKGKLEIQGLRMKEFHGDVVASFQDAVSFISGARPQQVVVKTVDEVRGAEPSVVVLFFVACDTVECRDDVSKKLRDPSSPLTIAMKMKSTLDEKAFGLEMSKSIGHISFHSIGDSLAVMHPTSLGQSKSGSAMWWPGLAVACAMTLAIAFLLVRARDDRMRRDFREMFARYTPLTTMDYEEEHEYGRVRIGGDASAW